MDHPKYFLMWTKPKNQEYITTTCGWMRKDAIARAVKESNWTWKEIYNRGGRIVKVKMTPQ